MHEIQWHNDDNDGDADDIHSLLTWIPIQITVLKNYLNFENICHNVRNEVRYALKNIMGLFVIFFKCQSPTPPFCKLEYVVIYAFLVLIFYLCYSNRLLHPCPCWERFPNNPIILFSAFPIGGNNKRGDFVYKVAKDTEEITYLYFSSLCWGHSCSKSL